MLHRWSSPKIFGATSNTPISGLSLIKTPDPSSLQVLAITNKKLSLFVRDTSGVWGNPIAVLPTVSVTGVPAFIYNVGSGTGNLDLVAPEATAGIFQSYLAYGDPTGPRRSTSGGVLAPSQLLAWSRAQLVVLNQAKGIWR